MKRNSWIALAIAVVPLGMLGLSFAAVPLYRVFCSVTGYGGTVQIGGESRTVGNGVIEVRFDANTSPSLPWHFSPALPSVVAKLGEDHMAFYEANNPSDRAITGVATYNVTPDKVGIYFHKTQCFCFNEQTLQPGQKMEFPLSFWVDPAIATDPATRDVRTITLSYTFFRSLDDAAKNGGLEHAGPHVGSAPYVGPRAEATPSAGPGLSPAPISR